MMTVLCWIAIGWLALSIPLALVFWACLVVAARADAYEEDAQQ